MVAERPPVITLRIPPMEQDIELFLTVRGCSICQDQITFPPCTTRTISTRGMVTAHTEWFQLTLPDGLLLYEQFDKKRDLSLLHIPIKELRHEDVLQQHLQALQTRAAERPLSTKLPDGRVVVLRQGKETGMWKCRVYQQKGEITHSWEASRLDALMIFGVSRYAIRLFDIPLEAWCSSS